ncbi:hypothetical protein [Nostoc sp.]|uniref:hypothetical protein n=1 Tax=Nostoc sp. TaxID=1180 RepID=UPI002FF8B9A9
MPGTGLEPVIRGFSVLVQILYINGYKLLNGNLHPFISMEQVIELFVLAYSAQGKTAVIPPRRNHTRPRDYNRDLHKAR